MQDQGRAFADRTGNELFRLLAQRVQAELSEQSDFDRYTAMMGAALIVVAEVLREPVEQGKDVDELIAFSSRWLRKLLEPVADKDKG
jgi:hypothetical protein